MSAEVLDDVVDLAKRDPIAETPLGPENGEQRALILGDVCAPERLLRDRRGPEVSIVEDRPAVARARDRHRQVRLPDPLREPGARRPPSDEPLDLVRHPDELAVSVAIRQGDQHRFGPAAAHDLDLVAFDEGP